MGHPQGDELVRVRPHPGAAGQFDDRVGREVVARALVPARTGQRDAPFRYSDLAIQALLTLKAVSTCCPGEAKGWRVRSSGRWG